jgi:hypothetical protein
MKEIAKLFCSRLVPAHCDFFNNMPRRCAIPRDSPKFFKILRIEMKNYSHYHKDGNVMDQSSMDIDLFNTNFLSDEI